MLMYVRTISAYNNILGTISCVFFCLSSVLAYFYCFMGYKKDSAKYFRYFCVSYSLYSIALIAFLAPYQAPTVFCRGVSLFILGAFTFGTNLGKKKSYTLAAIDLVLTIIPVVVYLVGGGASIIPVLCDMLLSIVFVIMIYAKYVDKDNRHTI